MNIFTLVFNLIIVLSIITLIKNIISPVEGETYQDIYTDIGRYIQEGMIEKNQLKIKLKDKFLIACIYTALLTLYSITYPIYLWIQYLEKKNN